MLLLLIKKIKLELFLLEKSEKTRYNYMKAEELDKNFDNGEDIIEYLDLSTFRRSGLEQKEINISFPSWMIEELDKEANRLGVERQSLIKFWISERLDDIVSK